MLMEEAKVSSMDLQLLIQCVHKLSQIIIESLNTIILSLIILT